MIYSEDYESKGEAMKRENQIKRMKKVIVLILLISAMFWCAKNNKVHKNR
jgi:predicted GIY-YIG superfamily endonuclease